MLLCKGNYIYTGITSDYNRRLRQHKGEISGGAKFTRSHKPIKYLAIWYCNDNNKARSIEKQLQNLSRIQKEKYVSGKNPPETERVL